MALKCGKRLAVVAGIVMATGGIEAAPSWAQDVRPGSEQAQAAERRNFYIPPQPLQSALVQFGQQSGRQIGADNTVLRGVNSPGVQGTLSIEEALQRLLAGTGLTYSVGATVISVQRAGQGAGSGALQLDPVQVQGVFSVPSQAMIDNLPPSYAGGQVATGGQLGLLGNRDVMDTPFNQTNYTAKKAQDQQAMTVRDVLIDDPSVRVSVPTTGIGSDNMRIRGFPVSNADISYGGVYGVLPYYSLMAELAERVEVLKGPSAMLNGMPPDGSIGGTINVVPKRAPTDDLTQLTASYVSAGQFGGHADLGRRFGPDKQFGVRFNGVFRGGPTAVEWTSDQRALALLGLDYRGEHFRLSADFGYQSQYTGGAIPYIGVGAGVPVLWAPNAARNPGQPWNFQQRKDLFGVIRAEVDMTERMTAYITFGAHDFRQEALMGGLSLTATNFYGNAMSTPNNRSAYASFLTGEAGLRALAETGPIGHEVAITATTYEETYGVGTVNGTPFATNIYNPTVIARPNIATPAANKSTTSLLSSIGIADTLSAADKRIQLTVGARLQQVQATGYNTTTGAVTSGYDQSALSPSVALVFKPWQNVSFYGNWIQGLQRGVVVGPAFTNAGEIFPPYKSTQFEVGVKVDWGQFTTTANVFQITMPSTFTDLSTNSLVLAGEQRNQGIELNVFGEPAKGLRLLGGAMFLNPVLAKTQGGRTDGWIAPLTPQVTLNLAGEWDLPFVQGLTLTGRAVYTGSQYIDNLSPRRSIAAWTRVDLGARYAFENPGAAGKLLVARFDVQNLLNSSYWESSNFLGAPQTFRLSLTADF